MEQKHKFILISSYIIILFLFVPFSFGQINDESNFFYSTFYGGSDTERIWDIALDSQGNIFIAGGTWSEDLPVKNAYQELYGGGVLPTVEYFRSMGDGFVAKFSSSYELLWSTYFGGTGYECINHIETDPNDNIIVVGDTDSIDFPLTVGSAPLENGNSEQFIAVFNQDGELLSSRLHAPGEILSIEHVDKDLSGNLVLGGYTNSSNYFCTEDAFQQEISGGNDGFIRVLSEDLETILFSTYIGGSSDEHVGEVATGLDGSIYVSGTTSSVDFLVTENCFSSELNGNLPDSFIVKIDSNYELVLSTYFGGSDMEHIFGLTEGPDSNSIIFVGRTWSPDFPITGDAIQSEYCNVEVDGFLTKLSATGDEVLYSTFFGLDSWDSLLQVNYDEDGRLVVTGFVHSGGFHTVNAFQQNYYGSSEAIIMIWGEEVELISYLGSYGEEHPFAQELLDGKMYVVGNTGSSQFPVTDNAYQVNYGGNRDGFIWVMDYDSYLTGDYTPEPPRQDPRPYLSYGIVIGVILVWFLYMKHSFRVNH